MFYFKINQQISLKFGIRFHVKGFYLNCSLYRSALNHSSQDSILILKFLKDGSLYETLLRVP
jgi:hypothetical protein